MAKCSRAGAGSVLFLAVVAASSLVLSAAAGDGAQGSKAFTPAPAINPASDGCMKLLYRTHPCLMESDGRPLTGDCCADIRPDEAKLRRCFHELYDQEPEELRFFLKLMDGCNGGAMPGGAAA